MNKYADDAAIQRIRIEGAAEDDTESLRNVREVITEHPEGSQHVDAHHKGHHLICHFGNTLDASQDD